MLTLHKEIDSQVGSEQSEQADNAIETICHDAQMHEPQGETKADGRARSWGTVHFRFP